MAQELGRSVRTFLKRLEEPLALYSVGAALCLVALVPFLFLAGELVLGGPKVLSQSLAIVTSFRLQRLFLNSFGLALAVTALSLLVGVPMGVLLGKTDVAGRSSALLLYAFPIFVPPFLLALGWFYLFGHQGFVGNERTAAALFSPFGAVAVLSLNFAPIVTMFVVIGMQGIDQTLEEAARLVAPPWRVVTRILVPLTWPAVATAALVVFALAFSELAVPMFLRVPNYPAAIFARLGGIRYDPGEAFALALPLLGLSLILLFIERRFLGERSFEVFGLRSTEAWTMPLRSWRTVMSLVCWLLVLFSITPLVALTVRASNGGFPALFQWIGSSPGYSLLFGSISATAIVMIGLVAGRAVARKTRGSRYFDAVAVLAFVAPASVLGVGLISVWNRPETRFVYGSMVIVILGLIARYGVIGIRTLAATIAQSSPHLEESAATFGAGFFRRMTRILLPMHWRGVVAAWLLALVFCLRDLDTVILFYPPGMQTLTIRIFTLEANGPEAVVAALALLHILFTAGVLGVGGTLLLRGRLR